MSLRFAGRVCSVLRAHPTQCRPLALAHRVSRGFFGQRATLPAYGHVGQITLHCPPRLAWISVACPKVNPFRLLVAQFRDARINVFLYIESTRSCILRVLANWYLGFIPLF